MEIRHNGRDSQRATQNGRSTPAAVRAQLAQHRFDAQPHTSSASPTTPRP